MTYAKKRKKVNQLEALFFVSLINNCEVVLTFRYYRDNLIHKFHCLKINI